MLYGWQRSTRFLGLRLGLHEGIYTYICLTPGITSYMIFQYVFTHAYIHMYHIYITGNIEAGALVPPIGRYPGAWWYFLILATFSYVDKRSGGVLAAVGRTKQVRTQQSRASGAGNLSRYCRFFGMQYVGHNVSAMIYLQ